MCNFILVGARADVTELQRLLRGPDGELDTHVAAPPQAAGGLPPSDTVVCVTTEGCSCVLFDGLGITRSTKREVHLAGPGYVFRRALAAATLRFGGIRLRAYNTSTTLPACAPARRRTTSLGLFLRHGLEADDGIVFIVP